MDTGLSQAEPASWHWRPALNKIRSETKVPSICVIRFRIAGVTAAGFPWENCARDAISRDKKRGPDVDFCGGDREGGGGKAETTKRGPRALSFEAMGRRVQKRNKAGRPASSVLARTVRSEWRAGTDESRTVALDLLDPEGTGPPPGDCKLLWCLGYRGSGGIFGFAPPITFEPFIASESKSPTDLDP